MTSADDGDLAAFGQRLKEQRDFFVGGKDEVLITRAPGRLDVMGGIADYSGSLVLELPLAAATFVAAQRTDDGCVTVRSLVARELGADDTVSLPLNTLFPGGAPLGYADVHALLFDRHRAWAAYVVGPLMVLAREHGARVTRGVRVLVDSQVPPSKGVASSAALEVAAMQAMCALYGVSLDGAGGEGGGRTLALACQRAENAVVGAPCGVMDQVTSACAERGRLLAIRCQPAEIEGSVQLPEGLELWGIDSGIRHEVGGAEYGDVRVGAFMGYRILADLAGLRVSSDVAVGGAGRVRVEDPRWHGYLANVTPSDWETTYRDAIPATLLGAEFLSRYGGITDSVTRVAGDRTYAVRQPTAHPIYENHRVEAFRALLESGARTGGGRRIDTSLAR